MFNRTLFLPQMIYNVLTMFRNVLTKCPRIMYRKCQPYGHVTFNHGPDVAVNRPRKYLPVDVDSPIFKLGRLLPLIRNAVPSSKSKRKSLKTSPTQRRSGEHLPMSLERKWSWKSEGDYEASEGEQENDTENEKAQDPIARRRDTTTGSRCSCR